MSIAMPALSYTSARPTPWNDASGRTLSLPRRRHLLELAQRYSRERRILILEDAAYRELRYDGPDLPSIKSFDADNSHVILAMSFSKSCAPGLKTGYGFLPRGLNEPVLRLKANHDYLTDATGAVQVELPKTFYILRLWASKKPFVTLYAGWEQAELASGKGLPADEYLFGRQMPNFFFHVSTAYGLLRRAGVEIGKSDYLGSLNLVDAAA